ncbi:UNVERIFIED_CONTAM: hypothetical protein PYX00_007306 [Menopon gallinae]|uniref:Adenylate kinase 7 n=1 Tax=Menopon gallinae TaxID=328185 RepID=A0AAW2HIR6_9NEOP
MAEPVRFVGKNKGNHKRGTELKETYPKLKGCKSIDLDELFQFSASRERAMQRNAEQEYEIPLKHFMGNMVFINHVDSYNGRVLADYLSEQSIEITKPSQVLMEDDEEEFMGEGEMSEEGNEYVEPIKEKKRENFYIIGTADFMKNPDYTKPESVNEIVNEQEKTAFLEKILTCGVIIYDISNTLSCHPVQIEEATWVINSIVNQLEDVQKHAPKLFRKYKDCRTFVLISTILTWAKTKPIDPDDPSLPFTERDYRKRRPHPNYKVHCDFEKKVLEIGKKFPDHLRTIVIGSGITYGREEDILHFLFKMAWLSAPELPLFSPGNNKIPLIHVDALANIVYLILSDFPKTIKYIVAVEQMPTSLRTIVRLISKKLGTGKIKKVSKEEAFVYPEIKQRNFDMLTVNLNIIPGYILNMNLKPSLEQTFKENIDDIITEFRKARNLKPVKIFIHGPPASGKTLLSNRLAQHYKIHHLHAKCVIEQGIQELKQKIDDIKAKENKEEGGDNKNQLLDDDNDEADEDVEEEEPEPEGEDLESLTQFLREIEDNMASNEKHRLDDQIVIRLFKRRMLSNACQNQGYVMDSFPKTYEDTKLLYEPDEFVEELDDQQEDDITHTYNTKIMPEFVASLDASDEYLFQRVIHMPQSFVCNTHYEEEEMCRRLVEFRNRNTEDNTCLIYYDELEVPMKVYNIEGMHDDLELTRTFNDIIQQIGLPRNYDVSEKPRERNGREGISSTGDAASPLSYEIHFPHIDEGSC